MALANFNRRMNRLLVRLRRIPHRKGYGIHSPFAFNLVTGVVYERADYYAYAELEQQFPVQSSVLPIRDLRLLFRLINHAQPMKGVFIKPESDSVCAYMKRGCTMCSLTDARDLSMSDAERIDWAYIGEGADLESAIDRLLPYASDKCVWVIRGIYTQPERTSAWERLLKCEQVRVSFDLYDFGLVYFEKRLNKEDYIIYY